MLAEQRRETVSYRLIWGLTLLLLFAAALRMQHIVTFLEWPDEVRTMWRATAAFDDMLVRIPSDWPPLYSLLTWAWVQVAGPSLEATRLLSVLAGVFGVAAMYRAALSGLSSLRVPQRQRVFAAVVSAAVMATFGYSIFAGVDARGYGLLLALGPLALWLFARWIRRPSVRRSAALALALSVLVYTSYTSLVYVGLLVMLTVLFSPRRWALRLAPAWMTMLLMLPLLPMFAANGSDRITSVAPQEPLPLVRALLHSLSDFGGTAWAALTILLVVALVLVNALRRPKERPLAMALVAWVSMPLFVWLLVQNNEVMKPRYLWWLTMGIALLFGYAVVHAHLCWQTLTLVGVLALPLLPVDFGRYRLAETSSPPFRQTFDWLRDHLRAGDVIVVDPECTCGELIAWDLFVPQYFPTGVLPVVDVPGDARRVWYLSNVGWGQDETLLADVERGRAESIFFGPWYFLIRLYEMPPYDAGVTFGDRIIWRGSDLDQLPTLGPGETFDVRLWWSAAAPVDADYSMSVAVFDSDGALVTQADGPVQVDGAPLETSAWVPGEIYEEQRRLTLPPDIANGTYRLVVSVYQWWDETPLLPSVHEDLSRFDDSHIIAEDLRVVS